MPNDGVVAMGVVPGNAVIGGVVTMLVAPPTGMHERVNPLSFTELSVYSSTAMVPVVLV